MDQNEALLQAVVRGTEMGKNTLAQLLSMTDDPGIKAEFLREQKEYREINQQAHTALAALGSKAHGLKPMERWSTKAGITGETLCDRSPRRLAQMVIRGSNMGISDCKGAQRACPQASDGAKQLAQQLCSLEQRSVENLRPYL